MTSTMHIPIFVGEGRLEYQDRPVPSIQQADDVLIQVRLCGICGTDLNILSVPPLHKATPGIAIGHEATGLVTAVGHAVTSVQPGDRVVVAPRLTCGLCRYCRRGLDNQCENYTSIGTSRDGAFAPFLLAPERAVFKLSPSVMEKDAVLFEPLSCVVGALARINFQPGDSVAIFGSGPIGLLFAMLCRVRGAGRIFLVGRSPYRLALAKEMGVDMTLNPDELNLREAVLNELGIGCDLVIDAVGNQFNNAIQLTRRGGSVILFGMKSSEMPPLHQYTITRNDLTIYGTFVGLKPFLQTINLLESGLVSPGKLVTHRLPLSDLEEGVRLMRTRLAMKVVVECS